MTFDDHHRSSVINELAIACTRFSTKTQQTRISKQNNNYIESTQRVQTSTEDFQVLFLASVGITIINKNPLKFLDQDCDSH